MEKFMQWADRRHFVSVRAMTLYITMWMTWKAFAWAAIYAIATNHDGLQQAAVIAAVTAPVSALQVFVFRSYMEAKQ